MGKAFPLDQAAICRAHKPQVEMDRAKHLRLKAFKRTYGRVPFSQIELDTFTTAPSGANKKPHRSRVLGGDASGGASDALPKRSDTDVER